MLGGGCCAGWRGLRPTIIGPLPTQLSGLSPRIGDPNALVSSAVAHVAGTLVLRKIYGRAGEHSLLSRVRTRADVCGGLGVAAQAASMNNDL